MIHCNQRKNVIRNVGFHKHGRIDMDIDKTKRTRHGLILNLNRNVSIMYIIYNLNVIYLTIMKIIIVRIVLLNNIIT